MSSSLTNSPSTTMKPSTTVSSTTMKPSTTVSSTTMKPSTTVSSTTMKPSSTVSSTTQSSSISLKPSSSFQTSNVFSSSVITSGFFSLPTAVPTASGTLIGICSGGFSFYPNSNVSVCNMDSLGSLRQASEVFFPHYLVYFYVRFFFRLTVSFLSNIMGFGMTFAQMLIVDIFGVH
jgi:hypothetical protein